MSVPELLVVQCYVTAGIQLPVSGEEAAVKLSISTEDIAHFSDLWDTYKQVKEHCTEFQNVIFPRTVSVASDIVEYGNKVPIYYGALKKIVDDMNSGTLGDSKGQDQLLAILDNLSKDAAERADNAQSALDGMNKFITLTIQDQGLLTPIHDKYKKEYEGEGGLIAQYSHEIENDQKLIKQYNDEYEQDVIIASTTATYAWIIPAGLVAAAVVAGIYGNKAVEALNNKHKYQDLLDQAEKKLRAAMLLKGDLELADNSLSGIIEKLNAALPILQKAKGIWEALVADINNVINTLKNDIGKAPTIIAGLGIDLAIAEWKSIAKHADAYRVNAFIIITTEDTIKANPEAYRVAA